jgi:hypothetical protein
MKAWLFQLANSLAMLVGYELVRESSKDQVVRLLKMLTPQNVGHELIRVGNTNDGGYLLPNDLNGIVRCISPGCDQNISFETDLLEQFSISSIIVDKKAAKPKNLDNAHTYIEKWIGVSESEEQVTLGEIIRYHKAGDLILQMDIEGEEYKTLSHTSRADLERFRIITIEFHHLSRLKNSIFLEFAGPAVFGKLNDSHIVIHVHPNNCAPSWSHKGILYPEVVEVTYIRRDRVLIEPTNSLVPNTLDAPNVLGNPEPVIELNQKRNS